MPISSHNWHAKTYQDAAFWRAEADKWERLAAMAESDGDEWHARCASNEAANCRQNARLKELEEDSNNAR